MRNIRTGRAESREHGAWGREHRAKSMGQRAERTEVRSQWRQKIGGIEDFRMTIDYWYAKNIGQRANRRQKAVCSRQEKVK